MDFDFQWLLIGLPVAFGLGWLASRFDLRQWRRDSRDAPRAYFKGLNLLLNEQQDKAIDAFIEAVQSDPDTTELHFALGNLFRRRGEFERAVRVHQHLLGRSDLKTEERDRAQRALALDYMKAGLFDRAEAAWAALQGTPFDDEAQRALLSLYERSRDWTNALTVAQRLEKAHGGGYASRIAHYGCELALEADTAGRTADGDRLIGQALAAAPESPRPVVLAGQRLERAGRRAEALAQWERLREVQPAAFVLLAEDYARCALAGGLAGHAREVLLQQYERTPAMDLVRALALLDPEDEAAAVQRLSRHLRERPNLSAAAALLARPSSTWPASTQEALQASVGQAARPDQRYRCAACGFEAQQYFWQCPGCLTWDSYPAQRIEEQ